MATKIRRHNTNFLNRGQTPVSTGFQVKVRTGNIDKLISGYHPVFFVLFRFLLSSVPCKRGNKKFSQ